MNRRLQRLLTILFTAFVTTTTLAQSEVDHTNHQSHENHEELGAVDVSDYSIFHLDSKWLDHSGQVKSLSQALAGKPTVGAIIYTSCEHACPMIVNDMMKIERKLGNSAKNVQFTLFSMDYKNDNPKELELYRKDKELGKWNLFVPEFQGSELELAISLGIRIKPLANGHFAHSNVIFVLDSDGTPVHQQIGLGLSPDESANVVNGLLEQ